MTDVDYANQLKIDNKNLEQEIQNKENEFLKYDRKNFYQIQDDVMLVYIQKVLTILYVVIYFFFAFILYSNPEKYSKPSSIMYLIIFAILPFVVQLISTFSYPFFAKYFTILRDQEIQPN